MIAATHSIWPFTFYLADNLKVLPQFADRAFDWLIDDPSYGISEDGWRAYRKINGRGGKSVHKQRTMHGEIWTQPIPSQRYFNQAFRVSKEQIVFGVNYFAHERKGFTSPGRIVWDKVNGQSNWSDCELAYCSAHHTTRMLSYMWNGMMQGESFLNGRKMQGNKKLNQQRIHDTEKPIELYKWIFHKYMVPGKTYHVLDCHGGSMSIALAAHYFNTWMGYDIRLTVIEKHKPYYYDAIRRFLIEYRQIPAFPSGHVADPEKGCAAPLFEPATATIPKAVNAGQS